MKLSTNKRPGDKKSDIKRVRREGNVPCILYSKGRPNEQIVINGAEFNAILRKMKPGSLPTTIFTLKVDGKDRRAIIKDIQYHPTTYQAFHIDFEELIEGVPVNVKVPINCIGVGECAGIKLGGFLRQVIRYVKVQCLPKDMPSEFIVDVKDLGIKQSKRLSDLAMPKHVKPLAPLQEVVVVISKRT